MFNDSQLKLKDGWHFYCSILFAKPIICISDCLSQYVHYNPSWYCFEDGPTNILRPNHCIHCVEVCLNVVDNCSSTNITLVCMCVEITGYLNIWQCCSLMLFSPWVEAERMWPGEPRRQIRHLTAMLPARLIFVQLIQACRKTSCWFSLTFF